MFRNIVFRDRSRTYHKQAFVFQAKPEKPWDKSAQDLEST